MDQANSLGRGARELIKHGIYGEVRRFSADL
jgi:hypothetical protein